MFQAQNKMLNDWNRLSVRNLTTNKCYHQNLQSISYRFSIKSNLWFVSVVCYRKSRTLHYSVCTVHMYIGSDLYTCSLARLPSIHDFVIICSKIILKLIKVLCDWSRARMEELIPKSIAKWEGGVLKNFTSIAIPYTCRSIISHKICFCRIFDIFFYRPTDRQTNRGG